MNCLSGFGGGKILARKTVSNNLTSCSGGTKKKIDGQTLLMVL